MRDLHSNLLVLSVGLLVLLAVATSQTQADVQQLTLADVNQANEQQESPDVRQARQFGFGGRGGGFRRGGFGGGFRRGGFGGRGFGGRGFGGPRFGPGFYGPPPPPPFFGGPFFG